MQFPKYSRLLQKKTRFPNKSQWKVDCGCFIAYANQRLILFNHIYDEYILSNTMLSIAIELNAMFPPKWLQYK